MKRFLGVLLGVVVLSMPVVAPSSAQGGARMHLPPNVVVGHYYWVNSSPDSLEIDWDLPGTETPSLGKHGLLILAYAGNADTTWVHKPRSIKFLANPDAGIKDGKSFGAASYSLDRYQPSDQFRVWRDHDRAKVHLRFFDGWGTEIGVRYADPSRTGPEVVVDGDNTQ